MVKLQSFWSYSNKAGFHVSKPGFVFLTLPLTYTQLGTLKDTQQLAQWPVFETTGSMAPFFKYSNSLGYKDDVGTCQDPVDR